MAFGPNTPLVTQADVLALLPGASADAGLPILIAAVSDMARRYCSREFFVTNYSAWYRGSNNAELMMKQTPIQSVTTVTIAVSDGNLVISPVPVDSNGFPLPQAQGYYFSDKSLILGGGWTFPDSRVPNVFVNYSAGYCASSNPEGLPADLYAALCYECASRKRELDRLGLKSAAIGGETTTYSVAAMQPQTKDVMNRYRRVTGG
jgi:hypothetical protein